MLFLLKYFFGIFRTVIRHLHRPLAIVLSLWLLLVITTHTLSALFNAFAPLCYLPGLYGSKFCEVMTPTPESPRSLRWADYPSLVEVQTAMFEHLLEESAGGSALSLEIQKAELATTDLVTLVRISDLKSRDTLSNILHEFAQDAKTTGRDLQKLSSKIGGTVDNIMAVNDYALHQIEATYRKSRSLLSMYGLAPWVNLNPTHDVLIRTFGEAMRVFSVSLQRLVMEAEVNLANLQKLEERLLVLHEVVTREDSTMSYARSELLAELWTKLGGNKRRLHNFDDHLILLKNLGLYRKRALAHVVAALQSLTVMSSDMEEMRERVAAPALMGSKILIEVHMKSIKTGIERLREGKVRVRRLEGSTVRRILGVTEDAPEW
ncbi:hypothetical protein FPV67DRAFT_1428064 [Lyophyllum atratum]|nr:hypothetical protein FPV67DRAFT_1428064 [Lyophyllum atratum]